VVCATWSQCRIFPRKRPSALRTDPSSSIARGFRGALAGKQLVLFFEKASLRTRLTLNAGMASLGGTSLFVDQTRSRLSERNRCSDIARNGRTLVDAVVLRTLSITPSWRWRGTLAIRNQRAE